MFIKNRRSSSPESDIIRSDGRKPPPFCKFNLQRLCPRVMGGIKCYDIHFDDNDSDNDDDDRCSVRSRERDWRDEKAPRSERRSHRDERSHSDEWSRRDERSLRKDRSYSDERSYNDELSYRGERSYRDEESQRDERAYRSERYDDRPREERIHKEEKKQVVKEKSTEICKLFAFGACSRGKLCPDFHPGKEIIDDDKGKDSKRTCVYFVRGLCKRGDSCPYAHPDPDLRNIVEKQIWLKFCKKFPLQFCDPGNCSFLHISHEDTDMYRKSGLITGNALGQAIRKALYYNIRLKEGRAACKEKLDGECTIVNCPLLHCTREDFMKKVLSELREEFKEVFGASECIFHSIEAQSAIIQTLLNPTAAPVLPAGTVLPASVPLLMPNMPVPGAIIPPNFSQPPPPFIRQHPPVMPLPNLNMVPFNPVTPQPTTVSSVEDIDKVLIRKLQRANDQIAKETEKYDNYVRALQEENIEMLKVLDPEQDAMSLDDIRDKLFLAFETINWRSNVKLMETSLDYQHKRSDKATPEYDNKQGLDSKASKQDFYNWPQTQSFSRPPNMPTSANDKTKGDLYYSSSTTGTGVPQNKTRYGSYTPPTHSPQNKTRYESYTTHTGVAENKTRNKLYTAPSHVSENETQNELYTAPTGVSQNKTQNELYTEPTGVSQNKTQNELYTAPTAVPENELYTAPTAVPENELYTAPTEDNYDSDPMEIIQDQDDGENKRAAAATAAFHDESKPPLRQNGRKQEVSAPSPTKKKLGANFDSTSSKLQKPYLNWVFDTHLQQVNTPNPCKLFMYNLTEVHNRENLEQYFILFGTVTKIDYRETHGYITFDTPAVTHQVLSYGGPHMVNGAALCVAKAVSSNDMNEDQDEENDSGNENEGESQKKRKRSMKTPHRKLFLCNFTNSHDKDKLAEYFKKFGKITNIKCRKYYGFVTYEDPDVAQQVLNHSEPHVVNGDEILVKKSGSTNENQGDKKNEGPQEESRSEYVEKTRGGSLAEFDGSDIGKIFIYEMTKAHDVKSLKYYFGKFGEITKIIYRESYGFIKFADPSIAEQIILQDEPHKINGDIISVCQAGTQDWGKPNSMAEDQFMQDEQSTKRNLPLDIVNEDSYTENDTFAFDTIESDLY